MVIVIGALVSVVMLGLVRGAPAAAAEELRDPFLFGSQEASTQPVLIGILWDASAPLALIDGESVTVGQTVAGWQVIAIQPDAIVIQQDARQQTLTPGSPFPG